MAGNESVSALWTYYPVLETEGKRGRKVKEYPNKYFMMYGDSKAKKPTEEQVK